MEQTEKNSNASLWPTEDDKNIGYRIDYHCIFNITARG